MPFYYLYIKFKNEFGGFDHEIEAENKEKAIERFKEILDEPIMPRIFRLYEDIENDDTI